MANSDAAEDRKVTVRYENLDLPSAYVESVQGTVTARNALNISFYSERVETLEELTAIPKLSPDQTTYTATFEDPFGMDRANVHLIRRIEANLIFTSEGLEALIPWLQAKLVEMSNKKKNS
ncbi:MAG: hypothetical protein OXC68_09200 [Aestuariivita sp.]|nr:hypothetical protein [Aestuariivita sp.]